MASVPPVQKNAPYLTVPQVRRLLKTVLPLKRFSTAEMIAYVQAIQQNNYRAYRSHRKRVRQRQAADPLMAESSGEDNRVGAEGC